MWKRSEVGSWHIPTLSAGDISTSKLVRLIDVQNANSENWLVKLSFSPASWKFFGIHDLHITVSKNEAVLYSSRIEYHTFGCQRNLGCKNTCDSKKQCFHLRTFPTQGASFYSIYETPVFSGSGIHSLPKSLGPNG